MGENSEIMFLVNVDGEEKWVNEDEYMQMLEREEAPDDV